MTLKAFIALDLFVLVLLFLLSTSATHQNDTASIKQTDTINHIRTTHSEQQDVELFFKGVLGQEPKISN